jgi:hypothetical protein
MKGTKIPPARNFVLSCRSQQCPAIAGLRGGVAKILSDGEELFVTMNLKVLKTSPNGGTVVFSLY